MSNASIAASPLTNRLIALLPDSERIPIVSELRQVSLKSGQGIYEPGQPLHNVYFPVSSVLSLIKVMRDGGAVEVGTIGLEGVSGIQAILNANHLLEKTICQVPGDAYVMPFDVFKRAMVKMPTLNAILNQYMHSVYNVAAQSVACNRLHAANERCARWLLMTHDRVGQDEFHLTQEFLAIMLGVNRPSVSIAAATLQRAGFIAYSRGNITVKDRAGLESAACECYEDTTREYYRLLNLPVTELRAQSVS
jgi:CRP-like cAMP-binding protein